MQFDLTNLGIGLNCYEHKIIKEIEREGKRGGEEDRRKVQKGMASHRDKSSLDATFFYIWICNFF